MSVNCNRKILKKGHAGSSLISTMTSSVAFADGPAALNWVVYKKRDKEGSRNAANAKDDHQKDLEMLIDLLTATRTDRTKTVSIIGKTLKKQEILLPSQIDTQFY